MCNKRYISEHGVETPNASLAYKSDMDCHILKIRSFLQVYREAIDVDGSGRDNECE